MFDEGLAELGEALVLVETGDCTTGEPALVGET